MLNLIVKNIRMLFNVRKYKPEDIKTMCMLVKEPFPIYNEFIELHKEIQLIDENKKLIGIYSAAEARKKASSLKQDIILLNENSTPAVCKACNFRETILKKFYEEIVKKRNQQVIKKAQTSKQVQVAANIARSDLEIKAKHLLQLAKKNFNLKVMTTTCKSSQKEEVMETLEYLKYLVQNKCEVEKDITEIEIVDEEKDLIGKEKKEEKKEEKEKKIKFSMLIKSKQNEFTSLLQQSNEKDPDQAIQFFLQKFYKQEDVQMRDLKFGKNRNQSLSHSIYDFSFQYIQKDNQNLKKEAENLSVKGKEKGIQKNIQNQKINIKRIEKETMKINEKKAVKGKSKINKKSIEKGTAKSAGKGGTTKKDLKLKEKETEKGKGKQKQKQKQKEKEKEKSVIKSSDKQENKKMKESFDQQNDMKKQQISYDQRETLGRILNVRLKRILEIEQ